MKLNCRTVTACIFGKTSLKHYVIYCFLSDSVIFDNMAPGKAFTTCNAYLKSWKNVSLRNRPSFLF